MHAMGYTTKFNGCINLMPRAQVQAGQGAQGRGELMDASAEGRPAAQPRLMCAACGKREVGAYEPVCPECRKSLEQAGILKPKDQRQQIGPLDV